MKNAALRFFRNDSGTSALEYALIAGGMAVAVLAAIAILSNGLNEWAQGLAQILTIE